MPSCGELGLPRDMIHAVRATYDKVIANYREVDRTFIERGFASLDAAMQRDATLFGPDCYEVLVYQQTHPEEIDEWRAVQKDIFRKLMNEYEDKGLRVPRQRLDEVRHDNRYSAHLKRNVIIRFDTEYAIELEVPFRPLFRQALEAEQDRLCTLWGAREPVRLFGKETIPLRKEVVNTVMADAFGALGFVKRRRTRGIDSFFKPLTDEYAMVFEPDAYALHKEGGNDKGREYDDWWRASKMSTGWLLYIGSTDKANNNNYATLRPPSTVISMTTGCTAIRARWKYRSGRMHCSTRSCIRSSRRRSASMPSGVGRFYRALPTVALVFTLTLAGH